MTNFVFVHGGMIGGNCWKVVRQILEDKQHVVLRTYPSKIFRRIFGLFWPIFDSFWAGSIRSVIQPAQNESKTRLKRTENSTETFYWDRFIRIYLEAVNKTQLAQENDMARSTMYHTLKSKNPTVKTLAKLVHACV